MQSLLEPSGGAIARQVHAMYQVYLYNIVNCVAYISGLCVQLHQFISELGLNI
jgi:hypothetical protein